MLTVHLLEDLAPEEHKHVSEDALTHPDSTSVQPLIRGDWVLFHPVYSDAELKAVQVRQTYLAVRETSGSEFMLRSSTANQPRSQTRSRVYS